MIAMDDKEAQEAADEAQEIASIYQGLLAYAGKIGELAARGIARPQIAAALAQQPEPLIEAINFGVMAYGMVELMRTRIKELRQQLAAANEKAATGGLLKMANSLAAKGIDVEAVAKADAENEAFEARRKAQLDAEAGAEP